MDTELIKKTILSRIIEQDGCWRWQGAHQSKGYGMICIDGENVLAHRTSYLTFVGEIPSGQFVCHKCDVRDCVNPEHLFLATPKGNTQDMLNKGREARGERNGQAVLSDDDIRQIRELYAQGGIYHRELAKMFNTTRPNITKILNNYRWKHI